MTDYGTVSFFGYPTLSEGVVRIWEGRMDRAAATELAALLLLVAFGIMLLERALRGQAKYYQQGGARRRPQRLRLRGWQQWGAFGACMTLLGIAFVLPVTQLVAWAIGELHDPSVGAWQNIFGDYVVNSVTLAGMAAGFVIGLGLIVAHGVRSTSITGERRVARGLTRLVTLGYAMPGAVVAVGVLIWLTPLNTAINDISDQLFGVQPGLVLIGAVPGLIYAYVVRFMAVGFNSVEASLDKVTPNMEGAARTLGARPSRVLRRIHMPMVRTGMAAGAILVFVDVMKELPATLMLRPFGMDTLALWAYFLAAESFWEAAAIPSLTILVVGLVPVLLLMLVGEQRRRDAACDTV
ncbi:MAG: iron ABC transporter permease [Chloroflexi bacterium]|nr:iron ABC transporter permease [Chloroflexota bacterium]